VATTTQTSTKGKKKDLINGTACLLCFEKTTAPHEPCAHSLKFKSRMNACAMWQLDRTGMDLIKPGYTTTSKKYIKAYQQHMSNKVYKDAKHQQQQQTSSTVKTKIEMTRKPLQRSRKHQPMQNGRTMVEEHIGD
jgi:hypothetical protein